jgi:hypothetical protein
VTKQAHNKRGAPPAHLDIRSAQESWLPSLRAAFHSHMRTRHFARRTEASYGHWIRRFLSANLGRHPLSLGKEELTEFLSHLATERHVSASTQNQALAALLFLYRKVLELDVPWLDQVIRAKPSRHLPVVMSRSEVRQVLGAMNGTPHLMAEMLYGAGLRLLECARLRVKDVDLEQRQLTIRQSKSNRDRPAVLPEKLLRPLAEQIQRVSDQHAGDVERGAGWVELPTHSLASPRMPDASWPGLGSFQRRVPTGTPRQVSIADITCMSRCFRRPFARLSKPQESTSASLATPSAIPLRRISWRMAPISGPFRNFWDTVRCDQR